jgi:hypothetical protein
MEMERIWTLGGHEPTKLYVPKKKFKIKLNNDQLNSHNWEDGDNTPYYTQDGEH